MDQAREDLVWGQYMKCDGLPDPVCVRQLNTYLSLWKEDTVEDIDAVLDRTREVRYRTLVGAERSARKREKHSIN